ncbi:MAG TPA: glutamine-hydrolyzing GMP synthase [Saprospiraceae bacterium]|nr:glutamine-hydrolyzing GMP synthase [Saprospiraceae bacterium]
MEKVVLILDFGSQLTQLIARRVRELELYCEIIPFSKFDSYPKDQIQAVILSGSPASVRLENSPSIHFEDIIDKFPVLGICYGAQLMAHSLGGEVSNSNKREYGKAELKLNYKHPIWNEIPDSSIIWMSHSDTITKLPIGFEVIASTSDIPIAAFQKTNTVVPTIAVQFHPEVVHTEYGLKMLSNFLFDLCKFKRNWTAGSFVEEKVKELKEQIGDDHAILALSGGVDSSVAALLMQKAIGDKLHCIFVDNGLLRKNEYEDVLTQYKEMGLNIKGVDAKSLFYSELKDVVDPEQKRKIIGRLFIEVFEEQAKSLAQVKYLCQGTIYPDVIESVSVYGPASSIKSHHNVGGLPDRLNLKIVEPLRLLFKDEVRRVGAELNLKKEILFRHPFPGPGLAIRIIGSVDENKVKLLQEADSIFISKLKETHLYEKIWQAGAILLPVYSVGVMGDERTYEQVLALRAVSSLDGMTAQWSEIPYEVLADISNSIINQVKGINRVVYDISSKPPATIEWE